jgi:hypothetical protein
MASFAGTTLESQQSRVKNWADSESDTDEEHEHRRGTAVEEEQEEESKEEESDSEEEEDEKINNELLAATTPSKQPSSLSKKEQQRLANLSKKELKDRKAKELEDLDSMLRGFSDIPPVATSEVESTNGESQHQKQSTGVSNTADTEGAKDDKSKRKKKKKTAAVDSTTVATPSEESLSIASTTVKDIASVLKQRTSTKKTAGKAGAQTAQQLAVAEALKAAAGDKKKKKDKTKFSEFSY